MENLTFTAFDIETATNKSTSICQIGYVVVTEGQITAEKSFLIQPPNNEYDARHSCIHGIDALVTSDKPLFPDVWEIIKKEFIGVYKFSKQTEHGTRNITGGITSSLSSSIKHPHARSVWYVHIVPDQRVEGSYTEANMLITMKGIVPTPLIRNIFTKNVRQ